MTRFDDAHPASKLTDVRQLSGPCCTLRNLGLLGPFQSQWDGNKTSPFASQEVNKLAKRVGSLLKSSAQVSSCRHVFSQVLPQGFHRTPPRAGQGRTTSLSDRISIFA